MRIKTYFHSVFSIVLALSLVLSIGLLMASCSGAPQPSQRVTSPVIPTPTAIAVVPAVTPINQTDAGLVQQIKGVAQGANDLQRDAYTLHQQIVAIQQQLDGQQMVLNHLSNQLVVILLLLALSLALSFTHIIMVHRILSNVQTLNERIQGVSDTILSNLQEVNREVKRQSDQMAALDRRLYDMQGQLQEMNIALREVGISSPVPRGVVSESEIPEDVKRFMRKVVRAYQSGGKDFMPLDSIRQKVGLKDSVEFDKLFQAMRRNYRGRVIVDQDDRGHTIVKLLV